MPPVARAPLAALALSLQALAAAPARAGESPCWMDRGVLVVAAEVAGVAGDYILDTGSPTTLMHDTRAQAEGFTVDAFRAQVRLAGLRLTDRPVAVADLDARTRAFPTPIAGVIGADLLQDYVLDVSFSPCRVRLWPRGRAPRLKGAVTRPLILAEGRPMLVGGIADGADARLGGLVLATGADAPARIADDQAAAPGPAEALRPYGLKRPRLRALSLMGELWENLPAGLVSRQDLPADALGEVGPGVLSHWRLRFDFPGRRLRVTPARP